MEFGSKLSKLASRKAIDGHKILLIAEENDAKKISMRLRDTLDLRRCSLVYYNLDGCYGFFDKDGSVVRRRISPESPADGIAEVIKKTGSSEVFIAYPMSYDTLVDTMMKLGQERVRFIASPEAYQACTGWVGRNDGWILPAVDLATGNLSSLYSMAKRCMDILTSLCILIFSFPLFVIIPILIKLTSGGPVFFTQVRCGHNGRPFKIYKFRTMVPDAEKLITKIIDFEGLREPVFKIKNDPRVTPLGRFVRKSSIDELPQIFNVIKGDLSLVGPRPEEVALVHRYNHYLKQRLMVKPGITGLQQVICRGSTSMKERMMYDLAYIKDKSLLLDLKILFKTIWVVAAQKRAT